LHVHINSGGEREEQLDMKKTIAVICALLMCLLCGGYRPEYPYANMKIVKYDTQVAGMRIGLHDLASLEKYAFLVVQGFVQEDSQRITLDEDRHFPKYGTKSLLHITKVYSGGLEAGHIISLIEGWYTEEIQGEKVLSITCGYMPSDPNREYIFFLTALEDEWAGTYYPLSHDVSRFPVPVNSDAVCITAEEADMAYMTKDYENIYAEIIEKYF